MDWKKINNKKDKKDEYKKIKDKTASISLSKIDDKKYVVSGKAWIFNPLGFDERIYEETRIAKSHKEALESLKDMKYKCDGILKK